MNWKPLASFTAEQTATFFAGGELGRPKYADPEVQRRQDRQREALRLALSQSVDLMSVALHQDSPETEKRLHELTAGAMRGDPRAKQLLITMLAELTHQALS